MTVRRVRNLEELRENLILVPGVIDIFNKVMIMMIMVVMMMIMMVMMMIMMIILIKVPGIIGTVMTVNDNERFSG